MLKNYFKIAIRNLLKNKVFSAINILGMAISLASFFIIGIYVYDELKYDRHITDAENKYRVYIEMYRQDSYDRDQAGIPPMFGKALSENYPEVEYTTSILNVTTSRLLTYEEKALLEPNGVYAQNSIFDMFSIPIISGDALNPLKGGAKMAISETLKAKIFGEEDPIGKVLNVAGTDFEISAVYQDFPEHSQFHFSHIMNFEMLYEWLPERMEKWTWQQFLTYFKLHEGASADELMEKFLAEVKEKAYPQMEDSRYIPKAMPIKDVHLQAASQVHDMAEKSNAQTIYILFGTAVFILIIACLNFVNLSTARAVSRMKEVGLRKVIGADKGQLVLQFIGEAVIVTLVALIIAGITTELVLPFLNDFTGKTISSGIFFNGYVIIALLFFAVLIGTAAGAYPAFHIAAYQPGDILSSHRGNPKGGKVLFRKVLVTLQFMITFFLITGAIIVSRQNNFIHQKDLGFNQEHIIAVSTYGQVNAPLLKEQFLKDPNILSATAGYGLPGEAYATDGIVDPDNNDKRHSAVLFPIDHNFIKTLGGEIIAGRDFDINRPSDSLDAFIINEKALELFDMQKPEEALGKKIEWPRWDNPEESKRGVVIGVIKNMHVASLKEQVMPMVLHLYPFAYNTVSVRVNPENMQQSINHMETEWNKLQAEWPFTYRFLDDNFDKMYKTETRLNVLFKFFTGFTIIVASMGLLGLVIYSLTLKMKEVGIRKVLGASVPSLIIHLSKGYVILLIIAFILAIPFSWYAAGKWLEDFQYRIEITPIIFMYSGAIILCITLFTVLIQALRTALLNPVDVIKDE